GPTGIPAGVAPPKRDPVQIETAMIEQSRGLGQIEVASRQVAKLAAEVTRATNEQAKALTGLTKAGDEVRRVAKQTAHAVAEQSDALASLASGVAKQTTGVAS